MVDRAGRRRLPAPLAALVAHLDAEAPQLEHWADPRERAIGLLVPVAEVCSLLSGEAASEAHAVTRALTAARAAGLTPSLELVSLTTGDERYLELRLTGS